MTTIQLVLTGPKKVQAKHALDADLSEVPRSQRRPLPKSLDHYAQMHQERDKAIRAACLSGGYTLKDLANYFDLHYSSVSRIINGKYYAK